MMHFTMKQSPSNEGLGLPVVIIILGIVFLGGVGFFTMKDPMGDGSKGEGSMESGTMMKQEDPQMVKDDSTMMKKEGEWTKEEMEAMEKDHTMMGEATGTMMKKDEAMMEKTGDAMMTYGGTMLGGTKGAPLLTFTKKDYDAAVQSGKLVTLFFYANWCPDCRAEFPKMVEAFNALPATADGKVIGFRVDYKDGETDADEKALAAEFGVSYQHTKVFVKNGVRVLKAPDTWGTARYASEIEKGI